MTFLIKFKYVEAIAKRQRRNDGVIMRLFLVLAWLLLINWFYINAGNAINQRRRWKAVIQREDDLTG